MLNESHQKMLQVIDERAASPDLANVPGGKTGIVTKTIKGIGNGDDFQIVEIYEVDTATIGKICDIQKLVAEELGQRVERTETVHWTRWITPLRCAFSSPSQISIPTFKNCSRGSALLSNRSASVSPSRYSMTK